MALWGFLTVLIASAHDQFRWPRQQALEDETEGHHHRYAFPGSYPTISLNDEAANDVLGLEEDTNELPRLVYLGPGGGRRGPPRPRKDIVQDLETLLRDMTLHDKVEFLINYLTHKVSETQPSPRSIYEEGEDDLGHLEFTAETQTTLNPLEDKTWPQEVPRRVSNWSRAKWFLVVVPLVIVSILCVLGCIAKHYFWKYSQMKEHARIVEERELRMDDREDLIHQLYEERITDIEERMEREILCQREMPRRTRELDRLHQTPPRRKK